MAKVRVYELAKEFGVESKAVMAELEKMGEFVRSASSTIEAPVVRRLKEQFAGGGRSRDGSQTGPGLAIAVLLATPRSRPFVVTSKVATRARGVTAGHGLVVLVGRRLPAAWRCPRVRRPCRRARPIAGRAR